MIKYKIPEDFKNYENFIQETIKPCNEITFKCEKTKPWDSKLGGYPYLTSKDDYPLDKENNPMLFLAQINLSDIKNLDELPKKGLLQFFVANDDIYGLEEPITVRYIENFIEDESNLVNENPYENNESYEYNLPFSRNGKMYFEERELPISSSLDIFDEHFSDILSDEEFEKLAEECDSSGSRIGGYPCFIQYDDINFSDDHFLLLQLDVEENCDIMFGDSGNCNFFISKEDLKNRDFSKVIYDWQCC